MKLDEIKARSSIVSAKPEGHEPTPAELSAAVRLARRDVPALVAAVEAVLAMHKEVQWVESWPTCIHCNDGEGSPLAYPCPTVAAIRTALGEVEQ